MQERKTIREASDRRRLQALESEDEQLIQRCSQSRIHMQTKTKPELSLVTAEDDTVTISAKSHFRAKLTTYDFLGQKGYSLVSRHAENFRATAKNSFNIKVKGDLNAEELADIQTLLEKFEDLANEFFSGSIDTGFANMLDTGFADVLASEDLDTITSFDAPLKFSQRIHIKQRTREEFSQAIPPSVSGSASPGRTPILAEGIEQFGQPDPADPPGKQFEDTLGRPARLRHSKT